MTLDSDADLGVKDFDQLVVPARGVEDHHRVELHESVGSERALELQDVELTVTSYAYPEFNPVLHGDDPAAIKPEALDKRTEIIESLAPGEDTRFLLASLVVVIVGGMGSIPGAALGALLIGLAEQFGSVYMPTYAVVLTFLIMVVVLAFRPQGLLGERR